MSANVRSSINVLSLDGGGVRGLSSLLLLRGLMERLAIKKAIALPDSIRPSDHFDLIIGTGTGGISALFLGRMHMTVDEAIHAYLRLAKMAFEPPASNPLAFRRWRETCTLDGQALERVIGDIVEETLGDRSAKMADPGPHDPGLHDPPTCRTAVLAAVLANADAPPHIFRSYPTRQPGCRFSIVEVARATVATAGVFKPVSLGIPPVQFVDAGHSGYNNPVEVGLSEATEIWQGSDVRCLVSIGTGHQQVVSVDEGWDQIAKAGMLIVQSCELIHDRIFRVRHQEKLPYFRFSVDRGLENVALMEWKKDQAVKLTGITQSYMQWTEVSNQLDICTSVLNGESLSHVQSESTNTQQDSKKFQPLHNPAPAIFHGHKDYVDMAVTMLCDHIQAFLCILGSGGIGKTAIACTILHDPIIGSKFGDNRFFVSCDGISSIPFVVDILCTAFGLQNLPSDRKDGLLSFLKIKYTTQPLLLVLDNFESVWEVEESDSEGLLVALTKVTGVSLLLTMRGAEWPAGVNWTRPLLPVVEPLSPQAAHSTFVDNGGKEDEKLGELLEELDYVPLAVTLIGHLGQLERPSHLLKRWKIEKTRLLSRKQGRLKNVDMSVHVSLGSIRMQSCHEALTLLSLIALLPNGVFEEDLNAMAPKISNCGWAAQTLCQVGLASKDSLQTLCVLAPIRAYITENYPPTKELYGDLETFHFERAKAGANGLGKKADQELFKVFWRFEGNMESVIHRALQVKDEDCDDEQLIRKVEAALNWTSCCEWHRPRREMLELALQITGGKQKCEWHHNQCLQRLGNIQCMLNNYKQAQEMLSTAQARFENVGDQKGAAQCLWSLGDIQRILNDYQQAQEMLYVAQARFEAIGDHKGAAQCLWSLGDIQRMLNNYLEAQNILSTAQTRFETIGDQKGAAQCLQTLGNIQCMLQNYQQAQEMLSTAQARFEATGEQLGAAQCLKSLGNMQRMLKNYQKAQNMLSTAQARFETIGDQFGAAQCLQSLGKIQHMLNNYQQAQKMFSTAQSMFEAIPNKVGAAQCLQSQGDIQYMLKNYQQAQEMLSRAQARFEAMGDQLGAAHCLKSLGNMQHRLYHYKQAWEMLSMAQARFEATGDQKEAAQCLWSLGDIQHMLNDYHQAQEMLSMAQARFEAIGDQKGAAQCLWSLGDIQRMLNNYLEAQNILSTAHATFEAIGDQKGVAWCLWSLGNIQRMLNNYQQAQVMLSTAQARFEAIGDQKGFAQCLRSLGNIQIMRHHFHQAQRMLSTAQATFETMGDQLGAAHCIKSLGNMQHMLHNYKEAHKMLSTAQARFEVIGHQFGAAQCLQSLGKVQHMLTNYQQAQKMFSTAQSMFESIPNKLGAAQCLQSQGDIHHMLKNYQQAQEMLSTAQAGFEAIGSQNGAAQCLQSLGNIQQKLNNYQQAQEMLSTAQVRFEAIGDHKRALQCQKVLRTLVHSKTSSTLTKILTKIKYIFHKCRQSKRTVS